jgi:hypothetical protein
MMMLQSFDYFLIDRKLSKELMERKQMKMMLFDNNFEEKLALEDGHGGLKRRHRGFR